MRTSDDQQDAASARDEAVPKSLFTVTPAQRGWRPLLLAGLLLAASLVALPLSGPLDRWCVHRHCPPGVGKFLQITEPFGHGFGILLIGLLIFQLDPAKRWAVPRLWVVGLGSGVLADLVKVLVSRALSSGGSLAASAGEILHGWLGETCGVRAQTCPSGHVAAATALALALSALYPRGRWLFLALAFFSACQRIEEGAHHPSDVLAGAAVGCLVIMVCIYRGSLAALLDRREAFFHDYFAAVAQRQESCPAASSGALTVE
jgi:membrane-associated phospholipid phosphatase